MDCANFSSNLCSICATVALRLVMDFLISSKNSDASCTASNCFLMLFSTASITSPAVFALPYFSTWPSIFLTLPFIPFIIAESVALLWSFIAGALPATSLTIWINSGFALFERSDFIFFFKYAFNDGRDEFLWNSSLISSRTFLASALCVLKYSDLAIRFCLVILSSFFFSESSLSISSTVSLKRFVYSFLLIGTVSPL